MLSIFYDLETSELNFVGQILNFAFVCVDQDWNIVNEFTGKIKISRLQLPHPEAILANRVNVLEHQKTAEYTEAEAMFKIREYLQDIVEREREPVILVGYNSNRFDLPFLRTSMIRNGVNPYFSKTKIKNKDVLHASQKLVCSNKEFQSKIPRGNSLSLSNIMKSLGLSEEEQAHESKADVMITIQLAKFYAEEYGLDIRTWDSYEPKTLNSHNFNVAYSVYAGNTDDRISSNRMAIFGREKGHALWINLELWESGIRDRSALYWYNEDTSAYFIESNEEPAKDKKIAEEARRFFIDEGLELATYFPPKNVDIEQFIYEIDIKERQALYEAIWFKDLTLLKQLESKKGSEIYLRWLIANKPLEGKIYDKFVNYAMYRYGGQLKLDIEKGEDIYHASYNNYLINLQELIDNTQNPKDYELLVDLKKFVLESDITKYCGNKLS